MLKRQLTAYLLTFFVGFAAVSTAFHLAYTYLRSPSMTHETLFLKERFYRQHAADYDLVFVGDSRTYCGFHPESLDGRLGRKSINLATFAMWFPTQLPFVQSLVHAIPPGTPVVWAVGHANFFPVVRESVSDRYPIGWRNAAWYLRLGFSPWNVGRNFFGYLPITSLLREPRNILGVIQSQSAAPLYTRALPARGSGAGASEAVRRAELLEFYSKQPGVGRVIPVTSGDQLTSVILYRTGGGYLRVEFEPEFFRKKQRELLERAGGPLSDAEAEAFDTGAPDPRLLAIFDAILGEFEAARLPLVVVEMEEAPFLYRNERVREKWRAFMDRVAKPRAEARGFAYVRPDFESLPSEDYFDYNHLNSIGVEKFSEILAPLLAAKLPPIERRTQPVAVQLP